MNRRLRAVAAIAAVLLLASCSVTKLAYNNLDWLASWELGKYLKLKGESESLFEQGFAALWDWHRTTQLSLYAQDLRELARVTAQPLTPAQVGAYVQRAQAHVDRIADQALPDTVRLLRALSDAQVAGMLERMADKRRDDAEDYAEQTPDELREDSAARMQKSLKRWLGSLTPAQKRQVQEWALRLRYEPAIEMAFRQEWSTAFGELLARRSEPGFGDGLAALLREPALPSRPAIEELQQHDLDAGTEFLSALSHDLSAQQRQHLQRELLELARDLEDLARPAAEPAPATL